MKLKQVRETRGLSQTKLAELSGVSRKHISDIETGRSTSPSGMVLKKIADALGVSIDYLMEGGKRINNS